MDENKELLTSENEAETVNSDADTENIVTEASETVTETEDAVTFGEELNDLLSSDDETPSDSPAKKKKGLLQTPIIISLAIVAIAAVALLVWKCFFDSSVEGTWHYVRSVTVMANDASPDEVDTTSIIDVEYYFDFQKDGQVVSTIGTVSCQGSYSIDKDENGNPVMTVSLPDILTGYGFLEGTYTISTSGNIFTGKELTLTNIQDTENEYKFTKASYKAPELKREDEFTPDEKLLGKWSFSDGTYNISYEFNKDGSAIYNEATQSINPYTYSYTNVNITINGIYSYTDDSITVTYYYMEETPMELVYELNGNTLLINGIPFIKDTGATADEA